MSMTCLLERVGESSTKVSKAHSGPQYLTSGLLVLCGLGDWVVVRGDLGVDVVGVPLATAGDVGGPEHVGVLGRVGVLHGGGVEGSLVFWSPC